MEMNEGFQRVPLKHSHHTLTLVLIVEEITQKTSNVGLTLVHDTNTLCGRAKLLQGPGPF